MKSYLALALFLVGTPMVRAADLKELIVPPVEKFLKERKNAGLVVGIRQNGQSSVYGFGTVFLPAGEQTPDAATMFEIGSITKGFTGILLAEAIRRGEVKLGAPVQEFLPPDLLLPNTAETPITLGHLATHHSGMVVQPPLLGVSARNRENPYADFDRAKLAGVLPKLDLKLKPDDKYQYSNLGAGLIGHALVHAAKADRFNDLLQARICKPLGMKNTTEALAGDQRARFARAHKSDGTPVSHWDFASLEACGGIRSCAADMLLFAGAALGDTKTELAPSIREAFQPRKKLIEGSSIGLFWMIAKPAGTSTRVWHNGSTLGHRGILIMSLENQTALLVLSAVATEEVDRLGLELMRLIASKKESE